MNNNETLENTQSEIQMEETSTPEIQEANPFTGMAFNRKFRRMLLKQAGYVKKKKGLGYRDWFENIKNNIQNGKQLHQNNEEEVVNMIKKNAEQRNESYAGWLLENGYSEEEAGDIIEKNIEINEKISRKKIGK